MRTPEKMISLITNCQDSSISNVAVALSSDAYSATTEILSNNINDYLTTITIDHPNGTRSSKKKLTINSVLKFRLTDEVDYTSISYVTEIPN